MNRAVWFTLVVASGCGGSYVPGSGTGFGEGRCDLGTDIAAVKAETTFCAPTAPPAPSICSKPLCYGPLGGLLPRVGFQNGAIQGDELPCQPTDGTDVVNKLMLSSALQKPKLLDDGEFYSSCKAPDRCAGTKEDCRFMMASPKACSPLAYVDAFVAQPTVSFDEQGLVFKTPYGGSTHDGDEAFNSAPFAMGAQGINGDPASRREMDIRPVEQVRGADRYTAVHVEAPWCRWYGAPVLVEPQYDGDTGSFFCSFRPRQGERVSAAGDWVIENVDVEIHDARFIAAVRPHRSAADKDKFETCMNRQGQTAELISEATQPSQCATQNPATCENFNRFHVMANGFFAEDTAQKDDLFIRVPIPPSLDPALNKLEYDLPTLTGMPGCHDGNIDVNIECKPDAMNPGQPTVPGYCDVRVKRNGAPLAERSCAPLAVCPCTNRNDTLSGNCGATARWDDIDSCRAKDNSPIAFARDIRVDWRDPLDAWECSCDCDDPSSPGETIRARLQGCATHDFADDETRPRQRACDEVCSKSPLMCGEAPNCRVGACRAAPAGEHAGVLLARSVCEQESPQKRVAPHGDFRAELDHGLSKLEVGKLAQDDTFTPFAETKLRGFALFNQSSTLIDFANLEMRADDFVVPGLFLGIGDTDVRMLRTVLLARAVADVQDDGSFAITPGHLNVGVAATLNGQPNVAFLLNRVNVTVQIESGVLTLDGIAGDGKGNGARIRIVANISNHPPVAVTQSQLTFECSAPTGTPVVVSAAASHDADPGDSLSHFQWFSPQGSGAGSGQALSATLGLGTHAYALHVYDQKLGSHSTAVPVKVVDTTPPELSASVFPSCAWSPNHKIVVLTLGEGLAASATDACDAAPTVEVSDVSSTESVLLSGSGQTDEDWRRGKRHVCFRVERSGAGLGRSYDIKVRATDSRGNFTEKTVSVLVPHDTSGTDGCTKVKGADEWLPECIE